MRELKIRGSNLLSSKTKNQIVFGGSGQGKGMYDEGYFTKHVHQGYKCIDLNSLDRGEGMFYGLPQDDFSLIRKIDFLTQGVMKPQSYKTEIIMFLGTGIRYMQTLPKNIKVCVFNEEDMDNQDLKGFIAITDSQEAFMETFFDMCGNKKVPLQFLYDYLSRAGKSKDSLEWRLMSEKGITNYSIISTLKKRALWLLRSGLFHNDESDVPSKFHYLDLEKSIQERDTITSYSRYLIEDKAIQDICLYMLVKKYLLFLEKRQFYIPIAFYWRELGDIYSTIRESPFILQLRAMVEQILRKGRGLGGAEVLLIADTQYPHDVHDSVFAGFNKIVSFATPIKQSTRFLSKCEIPMPYLYKLARAEVGMNMTIAGGQFVYPVLSIPTLHKKYDPKWDVFRYLLKEFGEIDYSKTQFIDILIHGSEEIADIKIPEEYYDRRVATEA